MTIHVAEQLADLVRGRYGAACHVPVDVELLARSMGVHSIQFAPLVEDGRLETDGSTARILIRDSSSGARQRFTIAHEIGHLLLANPGQSGVERRLAATNDVERFCDQFAAAVLLPKEWVKQRYGSQPQSLDTLRHLAETTRTSLAASLVRLQQTLGWSRMLLQWRNTTGRWRFRWGAGVPNSIHGRLQATEETRELFDAIRSRTGQDVEVRLPLLVNKRHVWWPAVVSCRGSSALVLVEPWAGTTQPTGFTDPAMPG